ncbi:sulfurtransferase [Sulfuricaulis sp.]|uniref:sulfurtransferase n=1 Tax=Sulfuricaulis sp. TaxID=2003553 RepID=UPI00345DB301
MVLTTLVDTETLSRHLDDPRWVVVDCRFALTDPEAGRRAYAVGHIPGARYAHLNEDLSSPVTRNSGRHPLPFPNTLAEKLSRWGIDKNSQVVVYDDSFGAMAARLWWLLRWLGHETVAVLDAGYPKWVREKRPVTTELPEIKATQFHPTINNGLWVDADHVLEMTRDMKGLLIDARAEERFRGEVEPLDKVAGHIPGANNMPYEDNLDISSEFMSDEALREHYLALLDKTPPDKVVHMCGSGVTACHSILAMEHAGLSGAKLYPGSWSEWIADPKRPVAKGE